MELTLDTRTNSPDIQKYQLVDWPKDHGIRIEMDMEASYQKGAKSIDEYLKETAITNPHCTIIYVNPKGEQLIFPRVTEEMPVETKIIKPHPYGIELGYLIDMLDRTEARTLQAFLTSEFSRVSPAVAKEICENAALLPDTKPKNISRDMAEKIMEGIKKTKIMAPPSDCLSPIGSEMLERGLRKEVNAEYYASISRPPSVYRGNPFIVEVAIAYGGDQLAEEPIRLMRFANRVPLLFQQGACAFNKSVMGVDWKSYGIQQSRGNLPVGPCTVAIHIASVWVPFTSESKEAIAHYPDIIKEVKLALQEVGRKLASYVGKKKKVGVELKKREYIQKYIPFVCDALKEMLALDDYKRGKIEENLKTILEQERGELDDVEFNPEDNVEFDESLAKMGKRNLDGEDDDIGKEEE
jgi:DNA topoisomerase-6 subunit B